MSGAPLTSAGAPRRSWIPPIAAAVVALLGFLPIANWIVGGHDAPQYPGLLSEWSSGSVIVIGGAAILAILSRRIPALWREDLTRALVDGAHDRAVSFGLVVAFAAFGIYLLVALRVMSGRPLHIDELAQLFQARIFLEGRLWRPAPPHPEFYSLLHVLDENGRVFGQFPPGGPAMLALGEAIGAPWLVGPLCGAIAVFAFWDCVRTVEPRRGVAVGATLLFAFAPLAAFMSGSHMNHVPTLMWAVIAMAIMARVMSSAMPRPGLAAANGFALGAIATIRPVEALACAFPAGVWYLSRALRDRTHWRDALASALGVAVPVVCLMWVNAHTTGGALRFGYEVLWGKSHALGFHSAPWGATHTPARGLELLNLYFLRLQTYLFETPIPSLVPAVAALALTRRVDAFDRYLLAVSGMIVASYFAYWHDGFYLGPRFFYLLLPALALWSARLPAAVQATVGRGLAYRGVIYGALIAGAMSLGVSVPIRARMYTAGLAAMRLDYLGTVARAGAQNALVFVRESWGAQVVARLWALGVSRSETELLYRTIDTCVLDHGITELEHRGVHGSAAFAALQPLLRDSMRVVKTTYSMDVTERVLPGTTYGPLCTQRLQEDATGFTLLGPVLVVNPGGTIFARDLHARDTLLIRQFPDRPLYLLRRDGSASTAPLVVLPLSRDSLERAWHEGR
jgi:hypothetical protein